MTVVNTINMGRYVIVEFSDGTTATMAPISNAQDMAVGDLSPAQLEAWNAFSEESFLVITNCPEDVVLSAGEPAPDAIEIEADGATGTLAQYVADEGYEIFSGPPAALKRTYTVVDAPYGGTGTMKTATCVQWIFFTPEPV